MWNGKMKAVTLSYDDGVAQDIRLIELLDRYGLRATFNLNPDRQRADAVFVKPPITVRHLTMEELPAVYANHEVAGHTCSHLHLELADEATVREEIARCRDTLAQRFGREITGMAYPYGTYTDRVVEIAREEGMRYARTCIQTETFAVPTDLMRLPTTCRHANPRLLELARAFVDSEPETPQLFFLWGHSYEFDQFETWPLIEEFCRIVSGREDIFYGTNSEVLLDRP